MMLNEFFGIDVFEITPERGAGSKTLVKFYSILLVGCFLPGVELIPFSSGIKFLANLISITQPFAKIMNTAGIAMTS